MQFNVPQFETEDKLVGPFTVVQFLYVAAASVISFLLFPLLATWFWFIVSAILVGGSLALALVKVGGRPMAIFLLSAAYYLWEPKTLIQSPKFAEIIIPVQAPSSPPIKKPIAINKKTIPSVDLPPISLPPIAPVMPSSKVSLDVPIPIVSSIPDPIISSSDSIEKISPLRNIFNKMLTSSSSISFREINSPQPSYKNKGYEFIQKPTGETIIARRVDYR